LNKIYVEFRGTELPLLRLLELCARSLREAVKLFL
jgi:hypothetical protein